MLRILVPAFDFAWNVDQYPKLIYKQRFIAEIFYRYIPLTFFFVWVFGLVPVIGSIFYQLLMLYGGYVIYHNKKGTEGFQSSLFYFVVLFYGFLGIRSFVGHTFMADTVAQSIGWATGSMFQIELAFYHLGAALATLAYIWVRSRGMVLAIIITKTVFLFGAMGVHLFEAFTKNNFNVGNIGPGIIYGDVIIPAIIVWLLIASKKSGENDL